MIEPARLQEELAGEATEAFDAGEVMIGHIANSPEPLIHLPDVLPFDISITKHVFMLWLVAAAVFFLVTFTVRRYLRQPQMVPSGFANVLEYMVIWVRDSIVEPNVGKRWVRTWAPWLLTFFVFILGANAIGMIPIFEVTGLFNHYVLHGGEDAFLTHLGHGGATATANFNVTAGLATVTFFSIIAAGTLAHGFVQHWKHLAPGGLNFVLRFVVVLIEIMGMFVRPFALTMRLAANMTGGHLAILAILSMVFLFAELFGSALLGIAVGAFVSVPLAVGISALELIVILVQAYVFTLLSAVFIGMAIHVHH